MWPHEQDEERGWGFEWDEDSYSDEDESDNNTTASTLRLVYMTERTLTDGLPRYCTWKYYVEEPNLSPNPNPNPNRQPQRSVPLSVRSQRLPRQPQWRDPQPRTRLAAPLLKLPPATSLL